ncbi:MAG: leucyl aminopeptidase [Pseudomonadota bacterium]
MKYSLTDINLSELRTPCLACSFKDAKRVARSLGHTALFNRAVEDFADQPEKSTIVHLPGNIARLLVVGGSDSSINQDRYRKIVSHLAGVLVAQPVKQATVALEQPRVKGADAAWKQQMIMQALSLAAYRYSVHKSGPNKPPSLNTVRLVAKGRGPTARLGNALDAGLKLARDLGNEPPNICNPNYLLKEARKLGRDAKVKVSNLDEKKMTALGMGAFMSVSKGSDAPGQMIIIEYNGGKKGAAPYALVGKGITFDTGGISLKPPAAMDEMKFDMCGAATVLGATKAVIEAGLPINLITVVAAAENMPSGRATRPGDIVTSSSGQTIEILNTDAEGRLVLCDALTHVQKYKPDVIIDVATLTGACIVALGSVASAVYANDDGLARDLEQAGQSSGDKAWRMPLWDEYQGQLRSNFADMANVGGREAGSVTAACFLARFIKDTKWAHMDVAGSAFHGGARKGASGRPVPLLFKYLCQAAGK